MRFFEEHSALPTDLSCQALLVINSWSPGGEKWLKSMYLALCGVVRGCRMWPIECGVGSADPDKHILSTKAWRKRACPGRGG